MADITLTLGQAPQDAMTHQRSERWPQFAEAARLHAAGRLAEAETLCLQIMSGDANHAQSLHLLGVIAAQTGRLDRAVDLITKAIALNDREASFHAHLGNALKLLGRSGEAIPCYAAALAIHPRYPEALCNLGDALRQLGRLDEAIAHYQQALAIEPNFPEALYNLGNALRDQGRLSESAGCYEKALLIRPDFPEALSNLGSVARDLGRLSEAIDRYEQALVHRPGNPEILTNLGNVLKDQGKPDEAIVRYEQALIAKPGDPVALYNLGTTFQNQFRLSEAIARYEQALAIKPDFPDALSALGTALQEQGRLDEASTYYQRAIDLKPNSVALQNLISLQLYRPETGLADIEAMARSWDKIHGSAFRQSWPIRSFDANTRPRIGFVSGDFNSHPVGLLVVPTVERLSRMGYHISCYANHRQVDETTARFQTAAARWRFIAGLSDDAVWEKIRADEIDILIDLSGHTGKNRLLAFARKPAPIQIAWAVGFPATTGLAAMDYLIADGFQVPAGSDTSYVEKIIRLPHNYIGFEPPSDAGPVGELPALTDGRVTFGSFNALKKVTSPTVAAWSRILRRVPNSRLLLKAPALNCEATKLDIRKRFEDHGIVDQLWLVGGTSRTDHHATMRQADIALDPFPYTGGITTLEALWSGLPVITLTGETFYGRHSFGYLSTIGLADLAAETIDRYVELAVGLAGDQPRLSQLRREMRHRMTSSPLCDIDRFVSHFDTALMTAWRHWCENQPIHNQQRKPPHDHPL